MLDQNFVFVISNKSKCFYSLKHGIPKFSTSPQVFLLHSTGEEPIERTSSLNMPTQSRAKEVARNFISYNPFFTVFIKPVHVADGRLVGLNMKHIHTFIYSSVLL